MIALLLLLAWAGVAHGQAGPVVRVTQPTAAATYSTTVPQLALAGTARARGQRTVTQVTWSTDTGQAGTAQGTTAWSFALTVGPGTTQLTVTAVDTQGRQGTDGLTIMLLALPPPPGPITLLWDYSGGGEAFQVERCTVPCGVMAPVASVAIGDRTWIDTNVAPPLDYCYRLAAVMGETVGPYSATVCSP